MISIPIEHKLALTIEEAAAYSNIGEHKIRELLKMPRCPFILRVGKRQLVKREPFEKYVIENIYDSDGKPKEEYYEGSCVYFITDGEYVKIGMTKDLKKRLASLQTANAKKLEVLKIIPIDNPCKLEQSLHKKFASKCVNYEWYDILNEIDVEEKYDEDVDNQRSC